MIVQLFLTEYVDDYLACFFMKRFGCKAVTNIVELSATYTINYLINKLTRKLPQIKKLVIHNDVSCLDNEYFKT